MTKVELSEVLRAHEAITDYVHECTCPWRSAFGGPTHPEHLADVVLAWVAERAGDAAVVETVENDVADAMVEFGPDGHFDGSDEVTSAALTAFVGSLGGPGASAGVEVAPNE